MEGKKNAGAANYESSNPSPANYTRLYCCGQKFMVHEHGYHDNFMKISEAYEDLRRRIVNLHELERSLGAISRKKQTNKKTQITKLSKIVQNLEAANQK